MDNHAIEIEQNISARIIELQTEAGGWTKESLAELGIPWPPPKGWKEHLESKGLSKPEYSRYRFPKQAAKGLCRGCSQPVPPGRTSWCSTFCWNRFEPSRVKVAIRRRDNHICQICACDIKALKRAWLVDRDKFLIYDERRNFTKLNPEPREEYDHIIPFSEGGLTILENMRTLCSKCHKKRTKEWRSSRRKAE